MALHDVIFGDDNMAFLSWTDSHARVYHLENKRFAQTCYLQVEPHPVENFIVLERHIWGTRKVTLSDALIRYYAVNSSLY